MISPPDHDIRPQRMNVQYTDVLDEDRGPRSGPGDVSKIHHHIFLVNINPTAALTSREGSIGRSEGWFIHIN